MAKDKCEVCGQKGSIGFTRPHEIVPRDVTIQAELPPSETIELCNGCLLELQDWNERMVSTLGYDEETKSFEHQSPLEMGREYKSAYDTFKRYKSAKKA